MDRLLDGFKFYKEFTCNNELYRKLIVLIATNHTFYRWNGKKTSDIKELELEKLRLNFLIAKNDQIFNRRYLEAIVEKLFSLLDYNDKIRAIHDLVCFIAIHNSFIAKDVIIYLSKCTL